MRGVIIMAKLFTRIYCEDAVLNIPGHIEHDSEVNEAVFYEGKELNTTALSVLEDKGVCEVSVFYFRYLDFPNAPEESATEEDLVAIDSAFVELCNEEYIVCDNDCEVTMRYWVDAEGQVNYETILKEFEDEDVTNDNEFVDSMDNY
jgi:hypothetical protein